MEQGIGLTRLHAEAQWIAVQRFKDLVATPGFLQLDEEALEGILDDDRLAETSEEAVCKAAVRWMKAGHGQLRGRGLLRRIRLPQMGEEGLAALVESFPAHHRDWIDGLVAEAVRAKAALQACVPVEVSLLDPRALSSRAGKGVQWEEYADGGERRLRGHAAEVSTLAECDGRADLQRVGGRDHSGLEQGHAGARADIAPARTRRRGRGRGGRGGLRGWGLQ